jgi:hypothetical protein
LKPAFNRAGAPRPVKAPPKAAPAFNKGAAQSPAIQAKRNFAKAAANPGAGQMKAKVQQVQKIKTQTK